LDPSSRVLPIDLQGGIDWLPPILILITDTLNVTQKHVVFAKLMRLQILIRVKENLRRFAESQHPSYDDEATAMKSRISVNFWLMKSGFIVSNAATKALGGLRISQFYPHKDIVPMGHCNHNAPCADLKCVVADVKSFLATRQISVD
jgi:hypothetical protein